MNHLRNLGQAMLTYETSKQPEKFPGFRQIMQIPNGNNPPIKAVVSWQIVLLPYLEKTDVYSAIQSGAVGFSASANPLPYIDITVCPSDNSIAGKSGPWTSYVCNTGRLDKLKTYNSIPNTVCVADYSVRDSGIGRRRNFSRQSTWATSM